MDGPPDWLFEVEGFEWDEGNAEKNWIAHGVTRWECEETFFNEPVLVAADTGHSPLEPRLYVLGRTDAGRLLFIVFTIMGKLLRVISARDMSRRERREYERAEDE